MLRALFETSMIIVEAWIKDSDITIESKANISKRLKRAQRMLYTWKNCFATIIRDIKVTNLIEHFIDLESNAKFVKSTLSKYTVEKREFVNRSFSELKDTEIITRRNSSWDVKIKFSSKKKSSSLLRIIHNFISINRFTRKSAYSIYHLEKVINILVISDYDVYFISNAFNSYWAISMKKANRNKTRFVISNDQWIYFKMNQDLKDAAHIYAQFDDLVFDSLSKNRERVVRMLTLLNRFFNHAFQIYMNDHSTFVRDFEFMFNFLHEQYFSRVAFDLIYFFDSKTHVFASSLELLDFQENATNLRFLIKHREKVQNWSILINRAKLNAFLWLTSFLRIFILERAAHVLIMKQAYLKLVSAESRLKKSHDNEMKFCDENLAKKSRRITKTRKEIVQRKYVKKNIFD